MSRADLTALIERVEAARGSDAMIDYQITWAAYPELALKWRDQTKAFHTPQGQRVRVLTYTGSLDAAASLVPDGWTVASIGQNDDKTWFVELREGFRTSYNRVVIAPPRFDAATPALALTAAALRARLASMGDDA